MILSPPPRCAEWFTRTFLEPQKKASIQIPPMPPINCNALHGDAPEIKEQSKVK